MSFTISPPAAGDRPAACRLLAARLPFPARDRHAARLRALLDTGELDPAGLFVARDESGTARGAVLVQVLPGALGLAWPPRAEPGRFRVATEDALTAAAGDWLHAGGVKVCQAFAAKPERPDMVPLERGGFRRVTEVVHMRRETGPGGSPARGEPPAACPLAFDPLVPDVRPTFAAVLLATYDGSRDCPELTGTRTPDEMLDGFRGVVGEREDWRFLIRHRGEPVGVVLFDVGTEPGAVELSYLGLVPAARGRGWGDGVVRYAIAFAAREAAALTLSVDGRNDPALRLYRRHGFRESDRRDVYLWHPGGE